MKKTIRCRLRCGRVIVVDADELLTVAHLKHLIVQQAKIDDAHDLLTLHLARVNDQWLNTDTTNNTEFQQQVQAILGGNTAMDRDDRVGDAELGFPTLSTLERGDIHVLVRLPGDGPTTQPNPPAAEVEITSRVEGAPVKGMSPLLCM
ncbi:hypothetical protein PR001_g6223 [Phytophthora rubi]|uniref:Crinkler effector protein N-terminal domain-containing protein n=1 Tax=Phytophthora rubi TaxID=129364 RepID=A0A6A3N0Z0_9STRA|nr:hypothetical protein PR002_g6375 [Phytophthora rubi]KAE9042379.1 hypothetical protein PR001_g6223 [Phytophthora rubi]